MRSTIMAAFTASAVLAMTSIVAAQATQQCPDTSNAAANPNDPDYGMTAAQENAIPYRACSNAVGWAHGRLVCRN